MRIRITKQVFGLLALILLFGLFALSADAQCAMCKAAVENASNGAELVRRLNLGIFVLLVPPVAIFCGIFGVAYRHRGTEVEDVEE